MPGPTAEQLAAMDDVRRQSARTLHQLHLESIWTLHQLHLESILKEVFSRAQIKQLDKWIKDQNEPSIDRFEAIRRLVELGLKAKGK
jgi:hypothetical protein